MQHAYNKNALIFLVAFVLLCAINYEGSSSALPDPLFGLGKTRRRDLARGNGKDLGSNGDLTHRSPKRNHIGGKGGTDFSVQSSWDSALRSTELIAQLKAAQIARAIAERLFTGPDLGGAAGLICGAFSTAVFLLRTSVTLLFHKV
ncbi:uncharacterized protein LOC142774489 [Rhipicephalus microplus]|uniref:uncharacterized protein LOC142774489 n=1 Tax=Rhipicephalus microplus TaxID=6941 RepID=UPI003F6A85DD